MQRLTSLYRDRSGEMPERCDLLPLSGSARKYYRLSGSGGTVIGCIGTNPAENRACFGDKPLSLTAKEFQLLLLFAEHPQKVYSKANLYESVWNEEYCYEDNTVSVHVSNLRSKLKKASGQDLIETVWGIGYRLKK